MSIMKPVKNIGQSGFTLVELLMAIIVGAIFAGGANLIIVQQSHLSQRGRDLVLANSFVEGKIESLRSIGFGGLNTGSTDITTELPDDLKAPHSGSLEITNFSSSIKKAVLSLTYNDQGSARSYSYTTYIGELGVGQY
ncbi:MAG TPA: prepilin-type N-terminal cleavage/methylation domain-containing protein [Candidatus Saccharimonadales bacterium]|nr:prepilin-type N-terminal cleavage/methylation domain-containing protein [Candidatus Saccharimonadales bacterium]